MNKLNVNDLSTTAPPEDDTRVKLKLEIDYRPPRVGEPLEDYADELSAFVGANLKGHALKVFQHWLEEYMAGTLKIERNADGRAVLSYADG